MRIHIPLYEKGIYELEKWQELEANNLKIIEFSSDDYRYLENKKYFDFLNVECNCLIDLYENEDISNEKLPKGLEITRLLIDNTDDERFITLLRKFVDIFELAIKCNTYDNIYCYGDVNAK
jgi:hypothetical protein